MRCGRFVVVAAAVAVALSSLSTVHAQDWESEGVDSEIDFISSNGRGLDFTPNSDGSHWLWFHDDGSSDATLYGAQLYSGGNKVWRLENRTADEELVHVATNGDFYVRGRMTGVQSSINFQSSGGSGLDFRPNSDGSHWLWVHDDDGSPRTEYGAQLVAGVGTVWRIENRTTDEELVHVDTDGQLYVRKNLGVGTPSPPEALTVAGNVLAEEVVVKPQSEWADHVFEEDYDLPSLEELSAFIKDKGHLPEVPSAEAVKEEGVRLGEMDATLLQKVEELTLYAIEQKARADSLENQLIQQQRRADRQEARADAQARRLNRLERQVKALRSALHDVGIEAANPDKPPSPKIE